MTDEEFELLIEQYSFTEFVKLARIAKRYRLALEEIKDLLSDDAARCFEIAEKALGDE